MLIISRGTTFQRAHAFGADLFAIALLLTGDSSAVYICCHSEILKYAYHTKLKLVGVSTVLLPRKIEQDEEDELGGVGGLYLACGQGPLPCL